MAKLPFVVEPRLTPVIEEIGSEESGKIEIERRGYLTSGEKAFFQQVKQSDQGTTRLIALSRKVSRAASIEMTEAYDMVIRILSGLGESEVEKKIEEEFAEDFSSVIQDLANSQASDEILMAACLLRYRINSNVEMDDIMKLHPDIIAGLANLYREEDNKVLERLVDKNISKEQSIEKVAKKSNAKGMAAT
jgi:hypothetical protein